MAIPAALFGLLAGFSNVYLWAKTEKCYIKAAPTYVNMINYVSLGSIQIGQMGCGPGFSTSTPTSPRARLHNSDFSSGVRVWPSRNLAVSSASRCCLGRPSGFGGLIVFNHTPDRCMYIYNCIQININIYIYIMYIWYIMQILNIQLRLETRNI